MPHHTVNIDEQGRVYVNGELLDEPYVVEQSLGESDITYPCNVSENHYFVLGDHREVSVDSRSTTVGCISREQVVGKIILCVWPFERIGVVR